MDGQYVNLACANEPVDDPIRSMHNLANQRMFEFRNYPARFREGDQSLRSRNEASDDDRRVVRRVLTDERPNCGQVGLRLLRPEDHSHDKNCFLTSSWDTSCRASDWRRPSSIFAMKHSRSMASSIVACSGKVRSASMARCFSVLSMSTILPSSNLTSVAAAGQQFDLPGQF